MPLFQAADDSTVELGDADSEKKEYIPFPGTNFFSATTYVSISIILFYPCIGEFGADNPMYAEIDDKHPYTINTDSTKF